MKKQMDKGKINNVVRIPTTLDTDFFRFWLEFLRPFHKLSNQEISVVASLLKFRHKFSKSIQDEDVLDNYIMSLENLKKVREDCGIKLQTFRTIISKLKKRSILNEGRINPKLIPKIFEETDKSFQLLIYFDFNEKSS